MGEVVDVDLRAGLHLIRERPLTRGSRSGGTPGRCKPRAVRTRNHHWIRRQTRSGRSYVGEFYVRQIDVTLLGGDVYDRVGFPLPAGRGAPRPPGCPAPGPEGPDRPRAFHPEQAGVVHTQLAAPSRGEAYRSWAAGPPVPVSPALTRAGTGPAMRSTASFPRSGNRITCSTIVDFNRSISARASSNWACSGALGPAAAPPPSAHQSALRRRSNGSW